MYDRIELNLFAKDVEYIYFIEYLHFDAQQHLCCGLFFENIKFSVYPRSKNWEFQILQIIDFLKTTKMIPDCQDLLRLLICASWSCIGVSWTCRDIAFNTFWIYLNPTPPHSPLRKDGSSEIYWKSHFSKSIIFVDSERWLSC